MLCPQCNTPIIEGSRFCPNCGMSVNEEATVNEPAVQAEAQDEVKVEVQQEPIYQAPPQSQQYSQSFYQQPSYYTQQVPYYSQPMYEPRHEIREEDLPEKFQPMGAWAYFWLKVLFAIPIVGFIFLIVFSFNDGNRSRRSFARSYWCGYLILAIILTILLILTLTGVGILDFYY